MKLLCSPLTIIFLSSQSHQSNFFLVLIISSHFHTQNIPGEPQLIQNKSHSCLETHKVHMNQSSQPLCCEITSCHSSPSPPAPVTLSSLPPCYHPNAPTTILPQGLCLCCFIDLEHFSPDF